MERIALWSRGPCENLRVPARQASKSTIGKQDRTMKKASMSVYLNMGLVDLMATASTSLRLSPLSHYRSLSSEHFGTPREGPQSENPQADVSKRKQLIHGVVGNLHE